MYETVYGWYSVVEVSLLEEWTLFKSPENICVIFTSCKIHTFVLHIQLHSTTNSVKGCSVFCSQDCVVIMWSICIHLYIDEKEA